MVVEAQHEHASTSVSPGRRELTALLAGCGVYHPDATLLSFTGRDRVRWLNGMVSNNIRNLAAGHGVYAFVLNAQGHIQGDLYAFNRGESLVLQIERAQADKLLQIFRRYIIMDQVEIQDLSGEFAVIGLAGPKSAAVVRGLGLNSGDLATLQFAESQWNGAQITLLQCDNQCVPSYELWVPKEHADSLWDSALKGGAEEVGAESLESFRIACGIPKIGQDIRERDLPQETSQERALSFTKGCYIGQEIVERIRSRGAVHRTLTGFEVDGSQPTAGTKIQAEGKDVGEITSVATIPAHDGEKVIALGYLRKEHAEKELTAAEAKIRPVSLPSRQKMEVN
jgi:folate-binding protein YgfZ